MRCSRFHILTFTTILSVLLTAWIAQAQYRHKTLLEDRFIHEPVTNEDCTVCHDPHFPEGPSQTLASVPDLCFSCHKDPSEGKKFVHAPLKKGECLSCHYPHSAPVRGLIKTTTKRLCVSCHSKKKDGRHGKSIFDGDCGKCHDPHASNTSNLIKASVNEQCRVCHSHVSKGKYKHSALEEYECQECHNPHISPPEPAIACDDCHDQGSSGPYVHEALDEGCQYCHDPHTGPYPNQNIYPIPQLCLECHDDMAAGRHGSVEIGLDCDRCHVPHSSKTRGLLIPSATVAPCDSCHVSITKNRYQHTPVQNTECKQCHDPHTESPPLDIPGCRECHPDVINNPIIHYAAEDGCGNCHDSHGSDHENQLIDAIPGLCLDCHDDKEEGKHGRIKLDDECGECHDPHSSTVPGLLTKAKEAATCSACHQNQTGGTVIHSALLENECDECHDPHTAPPEETISCDQCHDALLTGKSRHEAAEDDCSNCHNSHSGRFNALLTAEIPALCLDCHDDKEGGKHGDNLFGTKCSGCHEPHSSSRSKLLKVMSEDSCTNCHQSVTGAPYMHSALKQHGCKFCHNPHKDPPTMPPLACQECHLGVADKNAAHGRSSPERCLECHDPHGSTKPSLFKADGLRPEGECVDCHRDIGRDIDSGKYLHEPVAGGDCSECHTLHEGQPPFTLERFDRSKNVPFELEAYDLCFQCHTETMLEARFSGTDTSFRNGDLNLHNLHVVRDGENGYSCWVCHDTHASGQPHLIIKEAPFTRVYSLKIVFNKTVNGGKCWTNCHTVQEYIR